MYVLFVVLNIISYLTFYYYNYTKLEQPTSLRFFRLGIALVILWSLFRFLNYAVGISLVGLYADDWFVLALTIAIDFLFFVKLPINNRFVRYVHVARTWYTKFNAARVSLLVLGFLTGVSADMVVLPITNINKVDDHHLTGPYWENKQAIQSFMGNVNIVRIVKRGFIFKRTVFERRYSGYTE